MNAERGGGQRRRLRRRAPKALFGVLLGNALESLEEIWLPVRHAYKHLHIDIK